MLWTVLGTLAVVATFIVVGVIADRRFGLVPRHGRLREAGRPGLRLPPHAPGEAPETALAAPPDSVRCRACRRRTVPEDASRATYGDRALVVCRYRCTRCAKITRIYVAG